MHYSTIATFAVLALGASAAVLKREAERSGGFAESCSGIHLVPNGHGRLTVLTAKCKEDDGDTKTGRIDLNECLLNENGGLHYLRNGGFGSSCYGEHLEDSDGRPVIFFATCATGRNGGHETSSVNLNTIVGNDNGNLIC